MPYISRDFISQKLLPAARIEDVIGKYLTLKQRGSSLVCCCPFHHEKTPSFYVTPSKQMFYCFGCKEHGNAIDFIMRYKNVSFIDAVEELSQQFGLQVEYEAGASKHADKYKTYYELMDRAAAAFTKELQNSQEAQDYFYRKRGLTRETVIACRLGYAPDDWTFMKKVARTPEELQACAQLGLVLQREPEKALSFFRNRVIIPIADSRGRIVSFGGRVLGDGEPKYLNTAENPIFHKRRELFGLYDALQANRNRPDRLVIVEGYMDVISLKQAGISCAVASLGTATTAEQFQLMFRYTRKVICCYDGDNAGRRAAWHALETATPVLQAGLELRFAFLPPEHDPDSLVQQEGPGAFNRCIDAAQSYPEFLTAHVAADYDLADLGQRSSFINAVLHKARQISYQPLQAMVIEQLAQITSLESDRLYKMMDDVQLSRQEEAAAQLHTAAENPAVDGRSLLTTPMRRLVAFMLQQPTVVGAVYERLELDKLAHFLTSLKVKGADQAVELLEIIKKTPGITPGALIELMRGTEREHYCRVLIDAEFIPKRADGSEFALEDRAELLVKLIIEVCREPLTRFIDELRFKGDELNHAEMDMITKLNLELQRLR